MHGEKAGRHRAATSNAAVGDGRCYRKGGDKRWSPVGCRGRTADIYHAKKQQNYKNDPDQRRQEVRAA
tara:strand:- start:1930 stop:2133 length:204 start_codon:yes stop_codon:yes gene_type:complete